ncbi:MAG: hypothetical protein QM755_03235 [Luteolibacter sp.]
MTGLFFCIGIASADTDGFRLVAESMVRKDDGSKPAYQVYNAAEPIPLAAADAPDFDRKDFVEWYHRAWRGSEPMVVDSLLQMRRIDGAAVRGTALLHGSSGWIELGETLADPQIDTGHGTIPTQTFHLFRRNEKGDVSIGAGSFNFTEPFDVMRTGTPLGIAPDLALLPVGVGRHPWTRMVLLDLAACKPMGVFHASEMEILNFTYGRTLRVRFKDPVMRADLLSDPDCIEKEKWKVLTVVKDGKPTRAMINPSLFILHPAGAKLSD